MDQLLTYEKRHILNGTNCLRENYFMKAIAALGVKTGVDVVMAIIGFLPGGQEIGAVGWVDGAAGLWAMARIKGAINAARDKAINQNCKCP